MEWSIENCPIHIIGLNGLMNKADDAILLLGSVGIGVTRFVVWFVLVVE